MVGYHQYEAMGRIYFCSRW